MSRRLISFLIALVAIFFAFACLTAIRWPSIMMVLVMFFHPDPALGLENVNWRELGFVYGAPYFLGSLCFYAAAASLARRQGSLLWYGMGCAAVSPSLLMLHFSGPWWMDPSGLQGVLVGGALILVMLGLAALLLEDEHNGGPRNVTADGESGQQGVHLSRQQFEQLMAQRNAPAKSEPAAPKRRRGPVPAAIARQRAQFAADGRRMLARQGRL